MTILPLAAALLVLAAPPSGRLPPASAPPATPSAATAPAELSDAELDRRVRTLLGAIDTPIRDEDWRALGPRGAALLARRAQSADEPPSRRARAAHGLSVLGGSEAQPTLDRLARSQREPFAVRAAALLGLGRVLPPDRLVLALEPLLAGGGDSRVEAVAAEVLSQRAPLAACAAVRRRIAREPAESKAMFHRAEAACGADGH